MTEVVNAIIYFGFKTMILNRIEARCVIENIASARVNMALRVSAPPSRKSESLTQDSFRNLADRTISTPK